jgi:hypothetical protein
MTSILGHLMPVALARGFSYGRAAPALSASQLLAFLSDRADGLHRFRRHAPESSEFRALALEGAAADIYAVLLHIARHGTGTGLPGAVADARCIEAALGGNPRDYGYHAIDAAEQWAVRHSLEDLGPDRLISRALELAVRHLPGPGLPDRARLSAAAAHLAEPGWLERHFPERREERVAVLARA